MIGRGREHVEFGLSVWICPAFAVSELEAVKHYARTTEPGRLRNETLLSMLPRLPFILRTVRALVSQFRRGLELPWDTSAFKQQHYIQ